MPSQPPVPKEDLFRTFVIFGLLVLATIPVKLVGEAYNSWLDDGMGCFQLVLLPVPIITSGLYLRWYGAGAGDTRTALAGATFGCGVLWVLLVFLIVFLFVTGPSIP